MWPLKGPAWSWSLLPSEASSNEDSSTERTKAPVRTFWTPLLALPLCSSLLIAPCAILIIRHCTSLSNQTPALLSRGSVWEDLDQSRCQSFISLPEFCSRKGLCSRLGNCAKPIRDRDRWGEQEEAEGWQELEESGVDCWLCSQGELKTVTSSTFMPLRRSTKSSVSCYHQNGWTSRLPPGSFTCEKYTINIFISQQCEYIWFVLLSEPCFFTPALLKAWVMLEANLLRSRNTGIFNKPLT